MRFTVCLIDGDETPDTVWLYVWSQTETHKDEVEHSSFSRFIEIGHIPRPEASEYSKYMEYLKIEGNKEFLT